jgi:hypothetical protein
MGSAASRSVREPNQVERRLKFEELAPLTDAYPGAHSSLFFGL